MTTARTCPTHDTPMNRRLKPNGSSHGWRCRRCDRDRARGGPPRPTQAAVLTCPDCGRPRTRRSGKAYAYECRPCKYRRVRRAALQALGGRCVVCGTDEECILQIDHVDGGGNAERRSSAPETVLRQITRGERAGEFQVLCANDHARKTHGCR